MKSVKSNKEDNEILERQ